MSRAVDWQARRPRAGDETGSMAMFLMIAIMGLALGALLVPMIVTQVRTTRLDTTRVHALDAAHAGIDVMVGRIRASNVDGVGTSTLLPCAPMSGAVNGVGPAAYDVSIDYYMADPVAVPTAAKMRCVEGYGTYDPATDNFTPKFARISSKGTDGTTVTGGSGGRTLVTTYVFRTSNTNIAGGRIRIYPASSTSPELCMDAGSATPSAGTLVRLQPCASPPSAQQIFAYRSDLTIQLLSSISGTYPEGLCLDTQPPPTMGRSITLGVCSALGSPTYIQQWSFNDHGAYQASLPNSASTGALSPFCMNVATQSAGVLVQLAICDGDVSSPEQAWVPAPAVGAGAAEAPQLINYYEFGRCLDVTGQNVNASHLIDYPCKQNPNSASITWNQQFTTPGIATGATSATGQIYTTTGGTRYCLTSPGTDGGYVIVLPCSGTNTRQTWTMYNGSSALPYSAKYTIVDSTARCLGLTDPGPGWPQWSAIDVEQCTGATEQKWNATANLSSSALQDFDEVT